MNIIQSNDGSDMCKTVTSTRAGESEDPVNIEPKNK